MGATERLPREEPGHRAASFVRASAARYGNPRRLEPGKALAGRSYVGILERRNDSRDTRFDQQVAARGTARRLVRARLKRDVGRSPPSFHASLGQRHRLGMRTAPRLRPAASGT